MHSQSQSDCDYAKKAVYLAFEVPGVPDLAQQLPKSLHQQGSARGIVGRVQKEVPDGHHPSKDLDCDIDIVIVLHVVQANKAWHVFLAIQCTRPHLFPVQAGYLHKEADKITATVIVIATLALVTE